jgi:hypothetical protein
MSDEYEKRVAARDRARAVAEPSVSPSEMRRHCRRPPQHRTRRARTDPQACVEQPVGSTFRLNIAYPWPRVTRLGSSTLDLDLVTGRTVTVPLVWARCGVMGSECGYNASCVLRPCARSIIFTEESLVGTAMAFGTRHNGPVALRERI